MPFAPEFDDVYSIIKTTVESAINAPSGRCFRLDESRPAGRITDRLIMELRAATICVADLTETKPNVMWELGFAMALGKPTIIITQNPGPLPFDIHDMQTIRYQRTRLNATLSGDLKQAVLDTLGQVSLDAGAPADNNAVVLGAMLSEISQLKSIVAEVVAWKENGIRSNSAPVPELQALTGNWFNTESGSHVYSRVIRGELVSPYCYRGNDELTGIYFGWRRTGEYWYARFQWVEQPISGFTFLRMNSLENMSGAWWYSEDEGSGDAPPLGNGGIPSNWIRNNVEVPSWAEKFFCEVEEEGLASKLARLR
jgi:hypothetical protein